MEKSYYEEYKHRLIRKVVDKELDAFELIELLIHTLEKHDIKGDDLE